MSPTLRRVVNKLLRRDTWAGGEAAAQDYLRPVLKPLATLAASSREFVPDAIEAMKEALGGPFPHSAQVQARLLNRIATELRVAEIAAFNGYSLQAMTVTSVIFEHAHVIGYIGREDTRADEWLDHTRTDSSYPTKSMRKIVAGSLRTQDRSPSDIEEEMSSYQLMCMAKHGNPIVLKHHAVTTAPGEMTLHYGPFVNTLTYRQGLEALGEGVRLLVMAVYSFGYKRFGDAQAPFAQRVVGLLDEIKVARAAVVERLKQRT